MAGMTHIPCASPVSQGVSALAVRRFIKALDNTEATMRGFVLVRNNQKVAEQYWAPYTAHDKNLVYSISKSFTSTAAGLAYDAGLLDLDAKVLSFFPDEAPAQPDANLAAMRVRDLLAMNSGHESDPTVSVLFADGGDWVKAFLSLPVENAPGSHFVYNTIGSFMVSAIVQKLTGKTVVEYLREPLFAPLGFGDVDGDLSPKGIFTGGWGLFVRVEDLAKLGMVYLNKGLYEGKRILSEEWVELATSVHSDNATGRENESPDWRQGYGFQFWRCQHNCYRGDGAMGQYCVVMPEQNAVLSLMSEQHDMQKILDLVWDILLPGMQSLSAPQEAARDGVRYAINAKRYDYSGITFRFAPESVTVTLEEDDACYSITAGRGEWLEGISTLPLGERTFIPFFTVGDMPKKVSAAFEWTDADTLEITWVHRETPHRDRLVCRFEGEKVSCTCHSSVVGTKDADEVDFVGSLDAQP